MFKNPFWLALAIPAILATLGLSSWAASRRTKVSEALGRSHTLARSREDPSRLRSWSLRLRLAGLALLLGALAGPQWGVELLETRASLRQAIVAVDVSLSMRAQDVKPSRLDRAKESLSLLLDQLRGERVGVVAFAGESHTVCPLTHDIDAAKQMLGALEVGAVPTPGTAIGSAIRTGAAMIGRYTGTKTVVLLTDGEDHGSDPLGAAREAAASGVRVFAIGIGSPEGEPIPMEGGGYKKESRGSTVISRLDEGTLARVAESTGGNYFRSSPGMDEIVQIAAKIKAGGAAAGLTGTAARWRNRYPWPLALAFLLLALEMALPILPNPRRTKTGAAVAVLLLATPFARAATIESTLREGNKQYGAGRFDEALDSYGRASGRKPADPRPMFNAGDALYRLERDSEAASAFDAASRQRQAPRELRADALYNLGNARARQGDYAQAAESYRKALGLAPDDPDARHNLVVALSRLKNPPRQKNDKNDRKNPPKPDDKNKGDGQEGQGSTPPQTTRPRDALSREDAERVLRAVADREKAPKARAARGDPRRRPPTGEDW